MSKSGYWRDLATTDFAALDAERCIALLPVAAIEQHGPHLPLGTDALLNAGIIGRMLSLLPDDVTLLALPAQEIGDSLEHEGFPGTLSAPAEALLAQWTAAGEGVARAGLRKLVIFNSHGGQPQIVDLVAQRLRAAHRMLVARVTSFQLGLPEGLIPPDELAHGLHGGLVETAMMLHLHPELVRTDRLQTFRSAAADMDTRFRRLRAEPADLGTAGFAWTAQDLNADGVTGDAAAATAEIGAAIVDHMAWALAELVLDVAEFRLDDLRDDPSR
ncbi:MAG: creatininase family protein [Alphaproteobacteria bacterium]|nr:creatininase family protein [Alphaproteobacteria bacterium]